MTVEIIPKLLRGLREFVAELHKLDEQYDLGKADCGCDIPETQCPLRIAGKLEWTFARGALPEATLRVRNVGKSARTLQFTASALAGSSPGTAALSVSPASAVLAPGESVLVRARLERSSELTPCQDYHAEILVRGAWEQAVAVHCHVVRDPTALLHLAQGNSLKLRALEAIEKHTLHWEFDRGATPRAAITVLNASDAPATFNVEVTGPFAVNLQVQPPTLSLPADDSGTVQLELRDTTSLQPGQTYEVELLVHGLQRQHVWLTMVVRPDASGYVELEQAEPPVRRRAHRWHDHFQCTEGCLPGTH